MSENERKLDVCDLAPAFFIGALISAMVFVPAASCVTRQGMQESAVYSGAAQYNHRTGKFEWLDAQKAEK